MDKKTIGIITAVAVAAVLIIAGVAIFANQPKANNGPEVKFLIEDDKGVYFSASGNGNTVFDAFVDMTKKYGIEYVPTETDGVKTDVKSMFGMPMKQVGDKWLWWQHFGFVNNQWKASEKYMNGLSASENNYFAICYSDGSKMPSIVPSAMKVIPSNPSGDQKFLVESSTGLKFMIGGNGKVVIDAWIDACKKYNIPMTVSGSQDKPTGIQSMFGLEMKQVGDNWQYWTQQYKSASGAWEPATKMMNGLNSSSSMMRILWSEA